MGAALHHYKDQIISLPLFSDFQIGHSPFRETHLPTPIGIVVRHPRINFFFSTLKIFGESTRVRVNLVQFAVASTPHVNVTGQGNIADGHGSLR